MGFLKTRLTTKKERRSGSSPFGTLLSLLGLKKEEKAEELVLKDHIESFTDLKEQEVIQEMISDYENGNYSNFFQAYKDKLPLESVWQEEEFLRRAEKGSLLDLFIVWNLVSLNVLYRLESNAESDKEKLVSFVSKRMSEFYKEDVALDICNPSLEAENGFDLLYSLENIDQAMSSYGYRLLYFGKSAEEYFIGVFDQKTAEHLVGRSFGIVTLYPCSG